MKTLYLGNILTMADPARAEALLEEDGVILAVGGRDELLREASDARIIYFDGTLMPAFIDAHGHFTQMAANASQASVYGARSVSDMRAMLESYIEERGVGAGEWIVANDYDQSLLPHFENPSIEEIDRLTPHNPLVLRHKSCHMALFNSAALDLVGITAETEDVNIEKKDGKLTGYLLEGAYSRAMARVPKLSLERIYDGFARTSQLYASYGITTVQDGFVGERNLDIYDMLVRDGGIPQDIIGYVGGGVAYEKLAPRYSKYKKDDRVRIGGIKFLLDGSPQLRTAWVREAYVGGDSYRAHKTDEEVCDAFRAAARNKTQIIMHANGDAAIEQFLRCLEITSAEYPILSALRPTLIHAQLMGRDQIPRAAALGAVVSFFVAHCYHWGDTHLRNLGEARGMYISPVGSAVREGVIYTFHQDAPVIRPDMIESVWCAVNRVTRDGVELAASERVSAAQALRAVTANAAYQYFLEDEIGTLEVGKYADMVLLDRDPTSIPCENIREVKVVRTYKRGSCIFDSEK